ncbi:MAG: flippase-like domain-containing protein [Deltaproteobacteria bacterium]|nr:flippase-like domain-containing protein [Deltaproteobacteria bacterium]NND27701.1 flippase-like domain-containing protein [Myxococcales bacterium]MBT8466209.1 flippase-like domain-containing protein [Deltaproteobacteria bacterium]MBT8480009.1 flippase-like domain-containing protein [Deltaproteobacteria bacterium]NNK06662.1 flippase-like domain-containing protein [Myxococcales bacterium]
MRPSLTKERVLMTAGFVLSAILAVYFLRRVDLSEIGPTLASVNLWILSACLLTKGAVLSLGALRSKVFLRPLRRYRFIECFTAILGGYVTNNVFPFRLGELVRIDLLARAGKISRGSTVAVVGLERLLDLISFLVLFALVVPLLAVDLSGDRRLAWLIGLILAALLAVAWFAANPHRFPGVVVFVSRPFSPRIQAWLVQKAQRFVDGLSALRSSRAVAEALALTFAIRFVGMLTIQCWLWAFGLDLPIYAPLIVMVFLSVGTMVPSSPGFIGTFHVAVAYALELLGIDPSTAASVAIAGHFMATVPWTMIGLSVSLPAIRSVWKRSGSGTQRVEPVFRA